MTYILVGRPPPQSSSRRSMDMVVTFCVMSGASERGIPKRFRTVNFIPDSLHRAGLLSM